MSPRRLTRRQFLAGAGGVAAAGLLGAGMVEALKTARLPSGYVPPGVPRLVPVLQRTSGYVADGVAGLRAAFPLSGVRLLDSPFQANQSRNTSYLLFVDPDRLLHTFKRNVGLPSAAQPCGGWESPNSQVRGHSTGHLLSALAITYANTGSAAAAERGQYIVDQLARCQTRSPGAGFHRGYLSAFPESVFDSLEAGRRVVSPYYMIHKIMAGLIDQHQLAGSPRALEVAAGLADWVDWRTSRLPDMLMQQVLEVEYGGLPESLANLYRITGEARYLRTAERFYHARIFDPLARGDDELAGNHANTNIPKIVACVRIWEETGSQRYRDIAINFWRMVAGHHSYITGGTSNYEHWHAPGAVAGQLSTRTCENCCSYNMLKLTRLLHFHFPQSVDLLDYYERGLFNQMLGQQDPRSEHGFNIYYTALSPGAFKQQPSFMGSNPNVYSSDYDNFSCDHGTGMETQAKFADTVYSRDERGLSVNLFIPSEVAVAERGITMRQTTGLPDQPWTQLEVVSGSATMALRVRIPSWVAEASTATLNGAEVHRPAAPGTWLEVERRWQPGDRLLVRLPMRAALDPTPDDPAVQALTYGPSVLAAGYGSRRITSMPRLDTSSLELETSQPLTFRARADDRPLTLIPIARMHHQHYNVYWRVE
ncbi:MAG: glycoside hydrolase family 127 protein [Candidatus Dormibacteraeota bacterium]|nr:glycoside hydrolase family 127 protein [Candidatus Dormibacteraeota bacterium]